MTNPVYCVIAEDEKIFRDALIKLLASQWPGLEILVACEDGAEALEAIAEHKPAVAFLDIRMPGLSGIDVAAATAAISPATQIVFVTAYNQYAIDAFEKGAVDYLLKPIEPRRLAGTIERLKTRMSKGGSDPVVLAALVEQLSKALSQGTRDRPLVWLTASTGRDSRLILIEDVLYFQSDSKYTTVVTVDGEALLRTPLRDLIGKLDSSQFRQIHRSTIVNMKAIASIVRDEAGRGVIKLKGRQETLAVSLTYMPLFKCM
ncbi:MAG: response regulator transcription factor [Rhodanobacteraceae bacterium]|nr:response regulator transcription factor [Rhodanobacteraceae bacterium]